MTKALKLFAILLFSTSIHKAGFSQNFDGYALYNSLNSNTAYLIDEQGAIAHSWSCALQGNYALALKPNGNIVRGAVNPGNVINGAAVGGRVQEINPSGNIIWDFTYSDATHVSHHDLTLLPNGNVFLTAWEVKSSAQLQAAGYTGTANYKYPTHIIEVQQNGTGGQIVWEWHIWDHMIQDTDSNKPNFGVVADHPELMDINVPTSGMGPGGGNGDWFHVNGIDYNPDLDQIAFSSRFLSEIFIIDHSTTTQEAASHAGGNSGKGGDLLFRWGNPANFDAVFGTRTIPAAVHDVRWIKQGRPNAGYLQFFNNSAGPGNTSAVEAINPPLVGYNYTFTPGVGYGPNTYDWHHTARAYSSGQSASDRMPNGNTFVAVSNAYMYEVDSLDNLIWQYAAGPAKAFRYLCADSGIVALLGANPCGLVGIPELEAKSIKVYPNPSNGMFRVAGIGEGLTDVKLEITDLFGRKIYESNQYTSVDLSEKSKGIYLLSIKKEDQLLYSQKIFLTN